MGPADARVLRVEVVYCPEAGPADHCQVDLPAGATLALALQASGVLQRHPVLARAGTGHGIWGRLAAAHQVLEDGDRVELYRPLRLAPNEARRERHRAQRRQRTPGAAR